MYIESFNINLTSTLLEVQFTTSYKFLFIFSFQYFTVPKMAQVIVNSFLKSTCLHQISLVNTVYLMAFLKNHHSNYFLKVFKQYSSKNSIQCGLNPNIFFFRILFHITLLTYSRIYKAQLENLPWLIIFCFLLKLTLKIIIYSSCLHQSPR